MDAEQAFSHKAMWQESRHLGTCGKLRREGSAAGSRSGSHSPLLFYFPPSLLPPFTSILQSNPNPRNLPPLLSLYKEKNNNK